jgi:hypothetical protein
LSYSIIWFNFIVNIAPIPARYEQLSLGSQNQLDLQGFLRQCHGYALVLTLEVLNQHMIDFLYGLIFPVGINSVLLLFKISSDSNEALKSSPAEPFVEKVGLSFSFFV